MKTLHDYLTESKKTYDFTIKIAETHPEEFETKVKSKLDKYKVESFSHVSTTPIQAQPIDFPNKQNCEVHIYNFTCTYPVIPPQIVSEIMECGIYESSIRVHNTGDLALTDTVTVDNKGPLLNDAHYKEAPNVKVKDYYGNDHITSFIKDIAKAAKERKKDGQNVEYKLPKQKKTNQA